MACSSSSEDPADGSAAAPDLATPEPDLSTITEPDLSPTPDLSETPIPYDYPRVNEVAPGVAGVAIDEFVELHGGNKDTPLLGYSLRYQSANGTEASLFTFGDVTLPRGGYLLVAPDTGRYTAAAVGTYAGAGTGRLAAGGGAVGLVDAAGKRIDSLAWGTATGSYVEAKVGAAPGDQSLSRLPNGVDTNNNFNDARAAAPTPKAENR